MKFAIQDLGDGIYRITFNSSVDSHYNFETSEVINEDILIEAIKKGFNNIPKLTIETKDKNILIKYIPNNILRIIDRTLKIVNSLTKQGYKLFDDYEDLFSEKLLPYGRFLHNSSLNIITDRNNVSKDDFLYNNKIIEEQIITPKLSISNCLNHHIDDQFWSDFEYVLPQTIPISSTAGDDDDTQLMSIIEQQKHYIKTLENKINQLEYELSLK